MIRIIVLVSIFSISTQALAASAMTCFKQCKAFSAAAGAVKCKTTYAEGTGAIMVLDLTKQPSAGEEAKVYALRDCFFDASGGVFEIHKPGEKTFQSCEATGASVSVPFICERKLMSSSLRNVEAR